jgi:cytochrome P450
MDIDTSSPFSRAFDYASDQVGLRFQNPLYRVTELLTGSKFRAAIAEVKAFGQLIVMNACQRQAKLDSADGLGDSRSACGNLIDSLLEAFEDSAIAADAALNLLSAGRDTTAQSLTWTFYLLMRHPLANQRLRDEILAAFPPKGSGPNSWQIELAELQPAKLPYATAVFYEALRLCPPIPFELRQCESDITLPDGTFLPAGSVVVWCIWAMNRSPEIWGEQGPDLETFEPERWLQHGKFVSKGAFDFPVFNGGPRSCLGKRMAELIAAYVMVNIVREFDFEEVRDDKQPEKERRSQNSLTLPMQDGLPCKVRGFSRTDSNQNH